MVTRARVINDLQNGPYAVSRGDIRGDKVTQCDHQYDLFMLRRNPDYYGNTGAVRRRRRMLNRSWAVSRRLDYGLQSCLAYHIYTKAYGFIAGDPHND